MNLAPALVAKQERLKTILQAEIHEGVFERLIGALISRMLGVAVDMAAAGFQFGGDGGPSGRQNRRFRIETKRYVDTTSLSKRELLGEVDDALLRDEALEGWFLAATREVPEQLAQDLLLHAERLGVPVVIIDCKRGGQVWDLTALCTVDPDILDQMVSSEAADIARALRSESISTLERLTRDLQSWQLGFDSVRTASIEELRRMWDEPRAAIAKLGQDAAGGSRVGRVERRSVVAALDHWWDSAEHDALIALTGLDGVGKTWAGLGWLVNERDRQPIVLAMPASFFAGTRAGNPAAVKRLLAEQLHSLTDVRSVDYWVGRLERLLRRPPSEGPVLTLFLDGLNQASEFPWQDLFRTFQDMAFAGRVRIMVSTRSFHYEDRLRSLLQLAVRPVRLRVDSYDDDELDEMLAFQGLSRVDLHPDLIPLARRPRLFAFMACDYLDMVGRVAVD